MIGGKNRSANRRPVFVTLLAMLVHDVAKGGQRGAVGADHAGTALIGLAHGVVGQFVGDVTCESDQRVGGSCFSSARWQALQDPHEPPQEQEL